jgi:hypothetical protein
MKIIIIGIIAKNKSFQNQEDSVSSTFTSVLIFGLLNHKSATFSFNNLNEKILLTPSLFFFKLFFSILFSSKLKLLFKIISEFNSQLIFLITAEIFELFIVIFFNSQELYFACISLNGTSFAGTLL